MTDLRQSVHQVVQDAVDFASDASLEENTREGNECTDAVLSIFAAWLRERADLAEVFVAQAQANMAESPDDPMIERIAGSLERIAAAADVYVRRDAAERETAQRLREVQRAVGERTRPLFEEQRRKLREQLAEIEAEVVVPGSDNS